MDRNNNAEKPWLDLLTGILLIIDGLHILITGRGGEVRGFSVVNWAGWIFLPVGVIILVQSLRSFRTWKKPEPPRYTDEEARQAKAKLDRMFQNKYGKAPEPPRGENVKAESPLPEAGVPEPEGAPKPVPGPAASFLRRNSPIRQGLLAMLAGVVLFFTGNTVMMIMAVALFLFGLCRLVRGLMEVV